VETGINFKRSSPLPDLETTHVSHVVAPDHGDDDAIFVAPLTLVSGQDFHQRIRSMDHGGQQLDLLTVWSDNADILLLDTAIDQSGDELLLMLTLVRIMVWNT
jgi:hypothetical protein